MDERMKEIIKLREKELELVYLIEKGLHQNANENIDFIINDIINNLYNSVTNVSFNEEFASFSLPFHSLERYIIDFCDKPNKFKEKLSEFIILPEGNLSEEFVRNFIKSRILQDVYYYITIKDTIESRIFYLSELREKLKSLNIELNFDTKQDNLSATTKIPSLSEFKTRKLSLY